MKGHRPIELTFDQAATLAARLGVDLAHHCDITAAECQCIWTPEGGETGDYAHASGDVRCPARNEHTACWHDMDKLTGFLAEHEPDNGYTVSGIGVDGLGRALVTAAEESARYPGLIVIEDCDTGKTIARFRGGQEI